MFKKLLVFSALALPGAVHGAEFREADSLDSTLEEIIVSGYRSGSPLELNASLTLLDKETIQLSAVEHF